VRNICIYEVFFWREKLPERVILGYIERSIRRSIRKQITERFQGKGREFELSLFFKKCTYGEGERGKGSRFGVLCAVNDGVKFGWLNDRRYTNAIGRERDKKGNEEATDRTPPLAANGMGMGACTPLHRRFDQAPTASPEVGENER
jgi:hypothetical protein